jgi:hypothetical protein
MKFQFFIFVPLLLMGCSAPRPSDEAAQIPAGVVRSSFSVEAFKFIGPETTIQQVIKKLGEPAWGEAGGALPDHDAYYLRDGSEVCIGFGDDGKIVYVTHGKEICSGMPFGLKNDVAKCEVLSVLGFKDY